MLFLKLISIKMFYIVVLCVLSMACASPTASSIEGIFSFNESSIVLINCIISVSDDVKIIIESEPRLKLYSSNDTFYYFETAFKVSKNYFIPSFLKRMHSDINAFFHKVFYSLSIFFPKINLFKIL